jgi:hypothetical protein
MFEQIIIWGFAKLGWFDHINQMIKLDEKYKLDEIGQIFIT